MKSLILLLAVMCYVAVVCGKHIQMYEDSDDHHTKDHNNSPKRHRRGRRYSNYNDRYNYNNNAYEHRRDYNKRDDYNRQPQVLYEILDKLNEISFNMKISQALPPPTPPPPQIIYIMPQCKDHTINTIPTIDNGRNNFGPIWGSVVGDGSRPINFKTIKPDEPTVNPPPVEHGTTQAGATPSYEPGPCKAAILVCCQYGNIEDMEQCFARYDCKQLFDNYHYTCNPRVIDGVIEQFAQAYAPTNKQIRK